jgi:hypothetical protein
MVDIDLRAAHIQAVTLSEKQDEMDLSLTIGCAWAVGEFFTLCHHLIREGCRDAGRHLHSGPAVRVL